MPTGRPTLRSRLHFSHSPGGETTKSERTCGGIGGGKKTSDPKYKLIQSEIREDRRSVSESSTLELKLDIDELQELYTMCTRPSVRIFISQLVTQLVTVRNEIPYCHESNPKEKRTWSDIVAGRNPHVPGTNSAVTQNTATVITSRPSHHCRVLCGAEVSEIVHSSMVKKEQQEASG